MILTRGRMLGLAGLVLVLLLAGSVILQMELPGATGPHAVGRTSLNWTDPTRPEKLAGAAGVPRAVPVEIWYPAEAGSGAGAAYFPDLDRVARDLAASGEVSPLEVFGLRFVRSPEFKDAQVAGDESAYPVVILSPGNGTNVEFYAGIAGELASHGYVVAGINHPYDVAAAALPDGRVAQFAPGPFPLEERAAWVADRIAVRTADVLFVIAQLRALNASEDGLFSGRLNLARLAVMGHSLGGITAAEACRADLRIRACLNYDGLQRGGPFSTSENPDPPGQPFMLITKEPQLHPAILGLLQAAPGGSYLLRIKQASHDNFTDGPLLVPSLLPVPNRADRIHANIRAYTLAFFDQVLRQQAGPLLERSVGNEQLALEVYPPWSPIFLY